MAGFVLSRVRAHRLLIAAALLTVVLATSVLVILSAFAATIGDTGLRRSLEHQSAPRTVIDVQADVTSEDAEAIDRSVRKAARRAFDGLPTAVDASTRSGPYALPRALRPEDAGRSEDPDLTLFASLDEDRVRMTAGTWPTAEADAAGADAGNAAVIPVALPEAAAKRLGLAPGDHIDLKSRLSGPPPVRAAISGTYAAKDSDDPYWRMDPLEGDGVRTLAFTTYGPLAVNAEVFREALEPASAHWQAEADFSGVSTSRIGELRDRVRQSAAGFADSSEVRGATASSELPALLDALERTLLVGRSTLLIAALQLAVLAGLALLLVAQLLASERASETALLRARGGSRGRIAALSGAEALLLVLPGALLAPLVAVPVVEALMGSGALGRSGADPTVRLPAEAWWVGLGTALACAATVIAPSLRRRSDGVRSQRSPGRRKAAAMLRGGSDLALVAIAGVAYWQLERRAAGTGVLTGTDGGSTGSDALGIDPVLVTAPALALLAGTVLALRLLPLAARIGEHRAARSRGLAGALAGWQLSRRPMRGAGPALLLVLAVAMGVFAVGQGASWDRSQGDQADFRTGADVHVTGSTAPAFGQGGLYSDIEGVSTVAPLARDEFSVEGERTAQVLATDTRAASDGLLRMREDLTDQPLPELLRPLAGPGKRAAKGIPLPEDTRELRLSLRLERLGQQGQDDGQDDGAGAESERSSQDTVSLTLEDRFGVPYEFRVGDLTADGRVHGLAARLDTAAGGREGAPAEPLRLTRLTVSHLAPSRDEERRLTLTALESFGGDGSAATVEIPSGTRWASVVGTEDQQQILGTGPYENPEIHSAGPGRSGDGGNGDGGDGAGDDPLTVRYTSGSAPSPEPYGIGPVPVDLRLTPGGKDNGGGGGKGTGKDELAAVATDAFLTASGAEVGDSVKARISSTELTIRLTGSVRALPGTSPRTPGKDGGALLLDLASLNRALLAASSTPLEPESWWVGAREGQTRQVVEQLRAQPSLDKLVVRDELAAELRSDPLSAGPRTALTASALAAAALAAMGFAVSAAGAVRERTAEFAVLRALGAPRRRLAQILATEQSLLVLISLAIGLGLGILLTRLVVPLIVLTGEATQPVPELLVRLPLGPLTLLLGAVLVAPVLVIAATALRGADPVAALRTERGD
ncbi:ABC transporter permease [Streptomyces sp. N2-109]|uniref:ABC transporter permease n=1 Tax=Streptomyces gossypii TaxID=2883101 RepID=A0ABT2JRK0_9ACTN|nr:ABC transporter permease [Streptomyces gossypii]MCT2590510.1 ABC transporter permease [Streptomyces gossypii]